MALLLLALLGAACASSPVGVTRLDPTSVHRRLTRSALSTGQLSIFTRNVLLETNLAVAFEDDPEKALERLHDIAVSGSGGPHQLFVVAEASFLHAERTGKRPYHLAAALYAWAYLFPEDSSETPSPFDPRFQLAANLYNRGLTSALVLAEDGKIALRSGTLELPFGDLHVTFDPAQLTWHGRRMTAFTPIAEFQVFGLQAHYRDPGIGAPMAAIVEPLAREQPDDLLRAELTLPVTALLRAPRSRTGLAWPPLTAALEISVPEVAESVDIGGAQVPLEIEPTAVLAFSLADSAIWQQEYTRFFQALPFARNEPAELYATVPHRRGRIPVMFVHGTASSFGRWAEMFNRLAADSRLRSRYEFWFFSYDSGAPITFSAMLRESLQRAMKILDPDETDPWLRRMVVIGHSQGGLLTKMTAIDSGSRLWDANFKRPLDSLDVKPETRALLRRTRFLTPLPFVKRVVFLATPHRGSDLTVGRIANWLTSFITVPLAAAETFTDVVTRNKDALVVSGANTKPRLWTSVDHMNPRNDLLQALAGIPVAPGVVANSIIAVKGSGPVEDGEDGVVKYRSAHLEGVESELVLRSGHSLQDHPETVEEVRRILLLHARETQ
jgi:pimeloyl-ACP methyl ester carboxylesterase